MIDKIYATWVYASNLEATLAFYRDKLGLRPKFREGGWIEFDLGQTSFAILQRSLEQGKVVPQKTRIMFNTHDIESACRQMENAGIKLIGTIRDEPYGKLLTFEDPDGHWLELYEERKENIS